MGATLSQFKNRPDPFVVPPNGRNTMYPPKRPTEEPAETSIRTMVIGSIVVAVLCAAALMATSPMLPMAWDEGNSILRAEQIPDRWQYTTASEGHPAFYGMVIAAGDRVGSYFLSPLDSARLGPIVLFAVAAGAMFFRMWKEFSLVGAVGAVAALMLMPRMFAHAHFASFDGPLVSCWILTWALFMLPASTPKRRWIVQVLWGIALGMTLSCKATGWIAPVPFICWALIYRNRYAIGTVLLGLPVALLTFVGLNPPIWDAPLAGMQTFFNLNLGRADQEGLNISTYFLGRMYNLDHSLPWYNTLLWTGISVPLGILLLSLVGLCTSIKRFRADGYGMLLVLNWAVLMVVRALPGVPPHDGIRLFLPCFAFLAALAGVGCAVVFARAEELWQKALTLAVIGLLLVTGAGSVWYYAPNWLSYYNLAIGGLPGATKMGMEPTYYWDALDGDVLDWLHENTAEDEKVKFGSSSPENLELMRRWGTLNRETADRAPGNFRWYVIQHRPSGLFPADHWLIKNVEPKYRTSLLDVPLVEVYDYADYQKSLRETK